MCENRGGIATWGDLQEAAKHGYSDAIITLATIAVLEKGNEPAVVQGINRARVGEAVYLLRDAALFRIQMIVVRAFDPVQRADDIHLRAAVNFLRGSDRITHEQVPERRTNLLHVIELFDAAANDSRLSALKHMRNKELAHWARYGGQVRPMFRDLFGFVVDTCRIWECLSFGAGNVMIEVDKQIDSYRKAATVFWSPWK